MNRNKIIMLSFSLLLSNVTYTNPISYTLRATRRFVISATIGAYIHQNVMTQQDLTKMPDLSVEDVNDYKNKLKTTISNGSNSICKTYATLKKLTSEIKPSQNLGETRSFVDADIHDDFTEFQNQNDINHTELVTSNELTTSATNPSGNQFEFDGDVNSERRD